MIQTVAAPHGGMIMYRTTGRARRKARMGLYGLVAVAVMAGSGALVGGVQDRLAHEESTADMRPPGAFSYFPR